MANFAFCRCDIFSAPSAGGGKGKKKKKNQPEKKKGKGEVYDRNDPNFPSLDREPVSFQQHRGEEGKKEKGKMNPPPAAQKKEGGKKKNIEKGGRKGEKDGKSDYHCLLSFLTLNHLLEISREKKRGKRKAELH